MDDKRRSELRREAVCESLESFLREGIILLGVTDEVMTMDFEVCKSFGHSTAVRLTCLMWKVRFTLCAAERKLVVDKRSLRWQQQERNTARSVICTTSASPFAIARLE